MTDENIESYKKIVLISIIGTGGKERNYFSTSHSNVLNLKFDDVETNQYEPVLVNRNGKLVVQQGRLKYSAMTKEQGQKIVDFVKTIDPEQVKVIIVHCAAGVSRSGAVGTFLSEYFADYVDNMEFHNTNPHIQPNPTVLRILHNLTIYKNYTENK
jgi:predicted protein tyrosine phosphatase